MNSAYEIVDAFEKAIAKYAGSKYAVAVDSCCNAIFLCCKYLSPSEVIIPSRTYPGVACAIVNSGTMVFFCKKNWKGIYQFNSAPIVDGALRFKKNMYVKGTYHCLSFHAKKHIPIGRGGMILTDNKIAYQWFKKARFDGRSEVSLKDDKIESVGWNMYMTPEQAARGLTLFDFIKNKTLPDIDSTKQNYPDLSKIKAYRWQATIKWTNK